MVQRGFMRHLRTQLKKDYKEALLERAFFNIHEWLRVKCSEK